MVVNFQQVSMFCITEYKCRVMKYMNDESGTIIDKKQNSFIGEYVFRYDR